MCHWVLRIWKCGDSFFTKCSSCSFDRAANDSAHLLNPLHPSITPFGVVVEKPRPQAEIIMDRPVPQVKRKPCPGQSRNKVHNKFKKSRGNANTTAGNNNNIESLQTQTAVTDGIVYPRNASTGEIIPIPLSEVGKASRFGDQTLGENTKCNVFEVVLQNREATVCPACARSPRRARLPAHARGCFGLS